MKCIFIKKKERYSNEKWRLLRSNPNAFASHEKQAWQLASAVADPNVFNIGIIGGFGSGKTSLIRTFEKGYLGKGITKTVANSLNPPSVYENGFRVIKQKNVRYVSLMLRNDENDGHLGKEQINSWETEITQQLMFAYKGRQTKWSRFRRVQNASKSRLFTWIFGFLCAALGASWYFVMTDYPSLWDDWMKWLWLTGVFTFGFFFLLCLFLWAPFHKMMVSTQYADITLEQDANSSGASIFDIYADELVYLFGEKKIQLVVFEDLDRASGCTLELVEKIRNINSLLNQNCRIRKNGGVCFVYCVGGALYPASQHPTKSDAESISKIFDVTISIIPVTNEFNVAEYILQELRGWREGSVPPESCVMALARFLINRRMANCVINDYVTFISLLDGQTGQTAEDRSSIFALSCLKNVFPVFFDEISSGGKADTLFARDETKKFDPSAGASKSDLDLMINTIRERNLIVAPIWRYLAIFSPGLFDSANDKNIYEKIAWGKTVGVADRMDNASRIFQFLQPEDLYEYRLWNIHFAALIPLRFAHNKDRHYTMFLRGFTKVTPEGKKFVGRCISAVDNGEIADVAGFLTSICLSNSGWFEAITEFKDCFVSKLLKDWIVGYASILDNNNHVFDEKSIPSIQILIRDDPSLVEILAGIPVLLEKMLIKDIRIESLCLGDGPEYKRTNARLIYGDGTYVPNISNVREIFRLLNYSFDEDAFATSVSALKDEKLIRRILRDINAYLGIYLQRHRNVDEEQEGIAFLLKNRENISPRALNQYLSLCPSTAIDGAEELISAEAEVARASGSDDLSSLYSAFNGGAVDAAEFLSIVNESNLPFDGIPGKVVQRSLEKLCFVTDNKTLDALDKFLDKHPYEIHTIPSGFSPSSLLVFAKNDSIYFSGDNVAAASANDEVFVVFLEHNYTSMLTHKKNFDKVSYPVWRKVFLTLSSDEPNQIEWATAKRSFLLRLLKERPHLKGVVALLSKLELTPLELANLVKYDAFNVNEWSDYLLDSLPAFRKNDGWKALLYQHVARTAPPKLASFFKNKKTKSIVISGGDPVTKLLQASLPGGSMKYSLKTLPDGNFILIRTRFLTLADASSGSKPD